MSVALISDLNHIHVDLRSLIPKQNKQDRRKPKKQKEPFMSDKEWKEFEDEEDDMIFIDEIVEDD